MVNQMQASLWKRNSKVDPKGKDPADACDYQHTVTLGAGNIITPQHLFLQPQGARAYMLFNCAPCEVHTGGGEGRCVGSRDHSMVVVLLHAPAHQESFPMLQRMPKPSVLRPGTADFKYHWGADREGEYCSWGMPINTEASQILSAMWRA